MKIFLVEPVKNVGRAGEIVSVSDGFARNFLLPQKKGLQITPDNEANFARRLEKLKMVEAASQTKKSTLSDKIASLQITLKRKMHDDGKLYGSVGAQEIVDLLSEHGISISKNQVLLDKSIKERGVHAITIKLSSSLQPRLSIKIVAAAEQA